jgi:hypothetical protein
MLGGSGEWRQEVSAFVPTNAFSRIDGLFGDLRPVYEMEGAGSENPAVIVQRHFGDSPLFRTYGRTQR